MAEKPEVLTTTEARGGTGTHITRYVLIISVILAIGALVWVYALAPQGSQQGAATAGPQDGATTPANTR